MALQKMTSVKFLCNFRLTAKSLGLSVDKRFVYGICVFIENEEAIAFVLEKKDE